MGGMIFILIVAAAVRVPLVTMALPFYSSDTAVLDLMARHFLRGEFCLYYWGVHYYGVLDPILLMPLFRIFGASPQVAQVLPAVFSIVLLYCYHRYLRQIENPLSAHAATLFLAAASPTFLKLTFGTYNYVFGPLFGFLFLLLASAVWKRPRDRRLCWILGVVSGFARYYFGLILFFWCAEGAVWWMDYRSRAPVRQKKSWTLASLWREFVLLRGYSLPPFLKGLLVFVNLINLGNLVLAAALWFHGDFIHRFGSQMVKIFFSSTFDFSLKAGLAVAVVVEWRRLWRAALAFWNHPGARAFTFGYILGYLPALIGILGGNFPNVPSGFVDLPQIGMNVKQLLGDIFPYLASLSGNPVLAAAAALLLGGGCLCLVDRFIQLVMLVKNRQPPPRWAPMVFLFAINVLVGLVYLRLGNVATGRYFFPAYFSLALGVAWAVQWIARFSRLLAYSLFGLLLANNLTGDYDLIRSNRGRPAYMLLADQLLARGCRGGYAAYFTGYRLTDVAGEHMIFAETENSSFYPPYLSYVQSLDNPVLLEEPGAPEDKTVTIKGTSYRVTRRETLVSTPVAWLEKIR